MTRRARTAALALVAALLAGLAGVGVAPGAFALPAPTPTEVSEAERRVDEAEHALVGVQADAERAAEAYNGAQVAVERARATSATAALVAAQAAERSGRARAAAEDAQARAERATAAADRAAEQHARAVSAADAAQRALDRVIAGAYRSGGDLALVSALLDAEPLAVATSREVLNRVDEHQKRSLDDLTAARADAARSATQAQETRRSATEQAQDVAARAAQATGAAAEAAAAAAAATAAEAAAVAAAEQAEAARRTALALVAAAERELGSAGSDAAGLAAKGEQARLDAAAARSGDAGASLPPDGSAAATVLAAAYSQVGVPYAWGGGTARGPSEGFAQGAGTIGFDCSGLTLYAYAQVGIRLDHFTGSQWRTGRPVGRAELAPGDLMFFASDVSDPSTIHHVSIYVGGDRMVHAPHTGDVVKVSSAQRSDFIGGVRLL